MIRKSKVFTVAYLLSVILFAATSIELHSNDYWNNYTSLAGEKLVYAHVLRFLFALSFSFFLIAFGNLTLSFCGKGHSIRPLYEKVVFDYLTGIGCLSIFGFILAWIQGIYFATLFAFVIVIYAVAYRGVRSTFLERGLTASRKTPTSILSQFLFLVLFISICELFVEKAFLPDIILHDLIAHYLPYLNELTQKHGYTQTKWFALPFMYKGAFLQIFTATLADIQTIQCVMFFALLSLTGLIFVWVQKHCEQIWATLGALIFSTSLTTVEMQKLHVPIACCFLLHCYVSIYLTDQRKIFWCLKYVSGLAIIAMLPVFAIFLAPIFVYDVHGIVRRHAIRFRDAILYYGTLLSFLILHLTLNYALFGVAELFPAYFFLKHANLDVLRQWLDPAAVILMVEWQGGGSSMGLNLPDFNIQIFSHFLWQFSFLKSLSLARYVVPTLFFTACILRYQKARSFLLFFIVFYGFMFVLSLTAVAGDSMGRLSFFMVFFEALIGAVSVGLLSESRFVHAKTNEMIALVLCLLIQWNYSRVIFAPYSYFNLSRQLLRGEMSFSQAYVYVGGREAEVIASSHRIGETIVPLSFCGACSGLPPSPIDHPIFSNFTKDFSMVYFGDFKTAKDQLIRSGNNKFWFDSDIEMVLPIAFAPLWESSDLVKFISVTLIPNGFLVTLLPLPTATITREAKAFVAALENRRAKIQTTTFDTSDVYNRTKKVFCEKYPLRCGVN